MTIARFAHVLLALSLAACAGSTPPTEAPKSAAQTDTHKTAKGADPCAELPLCPVACPAPIENLAGSSCGSQGLSCGDDAAVCSCDGSSWACKRPERPSRASQCPRSCRQDT